MIPKTWSQDIQLNNVLLPAHNFYLKIIFDDFAKRENYKIYFGPTHLQYSMQMLLMIRFSMILIRKMEFCYFVFTTHCWYESLKPNRLFNYKSTWWENEQHTSPSQLLQFWLVYWNLNLRYHVFYLWKFNNLINGWGNCRCLGLGLVDISLHMSFFYSLLGYFRNKEIDNWNNSYYM